MFEIRFTSNSLDDIRWFKRADRRRVMADVEMLLPDEPTTESRNRKRLRPNRLAEWELRMRRFRVFYDIDPENELIRIVAGGYKKVISFGYGERNTNYENDQGPQTSQGRQRIA